MPYSSVDSVPSYVPKDKRKQWMAVFNSAYGRADGTDKEKEQSAFAQANAVAGPNAKVTKLVNYTQLSAESVDQCQFCEYYNAGICSNAKVKKDPEVPENAQGEKTVSPVGWCKEYELAVEELPVEEVSLKAMVGNFTKFIPFSKVDAQKREVWGIVTAEVPDKDMEVCDYAKSKPYYEELIAEMAKATDNENFMPLRVMHRTEVAGKGIGYEFRDADREVFMGFKVTTDSAWKQVEERVYTGFSHGGGYVAAFDDGAGGKLTHIPDPVFKDCERYVAKPAEVSLVDNPCLGIAHFTYISKTGQVELRKNRCVVESGDQRIVKLVEQQVGRLLKTAAANSFIKVNKDAKTKRVAGEDLSSSAFLIVGDPEKTGTWHLPVKFSSDAKTKRHIQNALARINQVKGISAAQREAAKKKLHAMAEQHGINVSQEKVKYDTLFSKIRRLTRVKVSQLARVNGDPGYDLTFLDSDLGKLSKGMYEVGRLAYLVEDLTNLVYCICCEQEWEGDETSPLPGMLEENLNSFLDTMLAMVEEESSELRDEVANRVAEKG